LLGASTAQVQLTLSSYLVGFAIGQIIYGPISDRYGRKPRIIYADQSRAERGASRF
jgi:MFS transporter, DHA1 family, multidrug resistance protein